MGKKSPHLMSTSLLRFSSADLLYKCHGRDVCLCATVLLRELPQGNVFNCVCLFRVVPLQGPTTPTPTDLCIFKLIQLHFTVQGSSQTRSNLFVM